MVKTGLKVEQAATEIVSDLTEKHKYRYVTLKFSDDMKGIVVDQIGERDATFQNFLDTLPKDHIRYVFYDLDYQTKEGQARGKVLMVSWSSDDHAPAKEKMLVSGSTPTVKQACKNFAKAVELQEWDELTEENFINMVSENRTK